MTPEELSQLTPEQKRVRIAELCGFQWFEEITAIYWNAYWLNGKERLIPRGEDLTTRRRNRAYVLPDYLNSLDAMAEARKVLRATPHTFELFCEYLIRVCNLNSRRLAKDWTWEEINRAIDATAAQHAEAFLLTVG